MCDYEQGLAASERTIAVYVNFMKLGHTWARFVRMRYDILDSNGKANIHSGPDITWNIFGLQRMCRRILTGLGALFRIFHLDCYFQARKNILGLGTFSNNVWDH